MKIVTEISRFYNGEIPLWKSYWIIGELINALVIIVIFNIELKLFNNTNVLQNIPLINFRDLNIINKLFIFLWTIFITVGIWKSAENYKGRIVWIILTLIVLSYRLFVLKELFY